MATDADAELLQVAATWYADLRESDNPQEVRRAHRRWLNENPRHEWAWSKVLKLQGALSHADLEDAAAILDKARLSRRQSIKLLSTLLALGVGGAGWQHTQRGGIGERFASHRTGSREWASTTLADGTHMHLNVATSVNAVWSAQARQLSLYRGEIEITTAKDPRPLFVQTKHGTVRALGTRFLVRTERDLTQATVLADSVEVTTQSIPSRRVTLETNQTLTFSQQHSGDIEPVQGDPAAWTRRQLIVSNWPLDKYLDELARYHPGVLSYQADVAALRISGAFYLNDTPVLLDSLTTTLPVRIRRLTPYWTRVEFAGP
ncbi:MAG: FecR domain-containing protein [Pseudomonadota bacterium]